MLASTLLERHYDVRGNLEPRDADQTLSTAARDSDA
jgi:hypothetical protein